MMLTLRNALVGSFVLAVSVFAAACTVTTNPPAPAGGCQTDSVVQCRFGTGVSCTDSTPPDVADPTWRCSDGTVDSQGYYNYCCIESGYSWGTCVEDDAVTHGCVATNGDPYVYGFSCAIGDDPSTIDSSLNCSAPTATATSDTYCCY